MVNIHYRIVHNLINGPKPLQVERIISDYLDEYPGDLGRLHEILEKAHSVVIARGGNGAEV